MELLALISEKNYIVDAQLGSSTFGNLRKASLQNYITHCVKSFRIRSYPGPHFPAFGLNTGRYTVSLRIQSECEKMRTRITPNTDTFTQ